MKAANNHLDYVDYLIDHRTWLAGATMSLADLTAAAHISVADYLGGIDWTGHEQTKGWYSGLKSRPSFRPLLVERMEIEIGRAQVELQSLMRDSYADFCLKNKKQTTTIKTDNC